VGYVCTLFELDDPWFIERHQKTRPCDPSSHGAHSSTIISQRNGFEENHEDYKSTTFPERNNKSFTYSSIKR